MSKGNPVVRARVPKELLAKINRAVADSLENRPQEPYTQSSIIVASLQEFFGRRERAKESRQRRRQARAVPANGDQTADKQR